MQYHHKKLPEKKPQEHKYIGKAEHNNVSDEIYAGGRDVCT